MPENDLKWFSTAELSQYKGEYIIILNQKVAMHGRNLKKMLEEFRKKYPKETPKIAKIPEENLLIL